MSSYHILTVCENCGKSTHQRCSRCEAFFVCSRGCMKSIWPQHKSDCDKVVQATKYYQSIGASEGPGVPCMISFEDVLRLDELSIAIYRKYGVDELPDGDTELDEDKKFALFLDVLRENDTCIPANRSRPLFEKLWLNRYYNGMYKRAKEVFTPSQLDRLHAQIKADHDEMAAQLVHPE